MMGEGPSYREWPKGWVQCRECREEMVSGLMAGHMKTHHWPEAEEIWSWTTLAMGEEKRTYRMAFPDKGGPRSCPVEGCPGRAAMRTAMRVHFLHRHVWYTVVILEEVNLPHPWCPRCKILVP